MTRRKIESRADLDLLAEKGVTINPTLLGASVKIKDKIFHVGDRQNTFQADLTQALKELKPDTNPPEGFNLT